MKKYVTIFLVIAMMISLSACGDNIEEYKYADNWEIPEVSEASATDILAEYAVDSDIDLSGVKTIIKDALGSYNLDWENFEEVNQAKLIDAPKGDLSEVPEELVYVLSNYKAFYDDKEKVLYILPLLSADSEEQQMYCTVHELVHALISVGHEKRVNRLEEGMTDYLTSKVMTSIELAYTPSYQGEMLAIEWLNTVYGEENVVEAVREDNLDQMIDASTKDGMSKKLNYALALAHDGNDLDKTVNVEFDILSHLAHNEGKGKEATPILEKDEALYASLGVKLDTKYFKKLLK